MALGSRIADTEKSAVAQRHDKAYALLPSLLAPLFRLLSELHRSLRKETPRCIWLKADAQDAKRSAEREARKDDRL
jgi:hypothetical protein